VGVRARERSRYALGDVQLSGRASVSRRNRELLASDAFPNEIRVVSAKLGLDLPRSQSGCNEITPNGLKDEAGLRLSVFRAGRAQTPSAYDTPEVVVDTTARHVAAIAQQHVGCYACGVKGETGGYSAVVHGFVDDAPQADFGCVCLFRHAMTPFERVFEGMLPRVSDTRREGQSTGKISAMASRLTAR